ncbi:hypothetical protein P3T27_004387 [Kitasatospora sp. MAA19]|uniref:hypothetical protein n=1 Tax=Kitasatospora sp. MAA19 TaxID=3035090 RepID=UPI0024771CD2|nr:hypothetical protein [Kitasatospora sp. MAA19]MDH6707650.1 hypothetical protein [Kitasatospora sp. MAA19]
MTVLHSRNADAADPADVADAADVKDPQDAKAATAESDLREDLGRYAELGAFTLTADTHAWYAAVDTVATPEDARAASTALAELRGRDLRQTWDAVTALAAEVKLDEPDTVAKTALLVELLQRVQRTSATLTAAAYDADLDALTAATADSTWRREHGVKLSWLRARSLRKQATALATDRRVRREDLHEALASAEIERRAWVAIAPAGTLPVVPTDGALVERTAQAFEAINTGLRGLARMLPDHDLDGLAFADLVDLVERLAADEGTLYRLPTIRGLRATLEEAGLGDLLAELTAAQADRSAAEAAYGARQALAGGQRDGLAGAGSAVEAAVPAPASAPASAEEPVEEPASGVVTEAELESEQGSASDSDSDSVEAGSAVEAAVEVIEEKVAEVAQEAPVTVVSLPAPSPAADDLVAAATAATAALAEAAESAEAVAEPTAAVEAPEDTETEAVVETPAAEAEAEVEVEVEAESAEETPALEDAPVVEPEAVEEAVETAAEPEPELVAQVEAAEAPAVEAAEPVAEVVVEVVEEASAVVVEPVVEVEAVVEPAAAEEPVVAVEAIEAAEPVAEVEAPVVPVEVVEAAEPVAVVEVEVEVVEEASAVVVEPVVEVEAVVEPAAAEELVVAVEVIEAEEPVAEVEAVEEAPAAEPVAEPAATDRPEKPDFTPGRPVTAYSADELLAVVRWVDGDGVERTDEELLRAAMKELGFARLGPRIKEALGAAVTAARG